MMNTAQPTSESLLLNLYGNLEEFTCAQLMDSGDMTQTNL